MIEYGPNGQSIDHGPTGRGDFRRKNIARQSDLIGIRKKLEKKKYRKGAAFIKAHKEAQGEKGLTSRQLPDPYKNVGPTEHAVVRETFKPGPYTRYWTNDKGVATQNTWKAEPIDYKRYDRGNCFRTEQEAAEWVEPKPFAPYRQFNPKIF